MPCKIDQCSELKVHGHGMCGRHYRTWRKQTEVRVCSIEGCGKPFKSEGLCIKHYERLRKNGSALMTQCPPNGSGEAFFRAALKSDTDDCVLWPYTVDSVGYGHTYYEGKKYRAHRLMCELSHGPQPPDKRVVAHWCGTKRCLNPRHLRWASHQENADDNRRLGVKTGRKPYGQSAAKSRL